ncbi:MAG: SUMF1/EgtB/PvdO family nonheme iron enzyme [Myxococcota bacterium]
MKLTPFARLFIALVSVSVIAYAVLSRNKSSSSGEEEAQAPVSSGSSENEAPPASSGLFSRLTGGQENGSTPTAGEDLTSKVGTVDVAMKRIPGGSFPAGQAGTPTSVETFYIDVTEVTQAQYQAFLASQPNLRPPPSMAAGVSGDGMLPVSGVSWSEAQKFCGSVGKRLPSGLEWERAARGDDGRKLPWGNEIDEKRLNLNKNAATGGEQERLVSTQAEAYRQDSSPYGVLGMGGNLAEWVADEAGEGKYQVRGGSWASYAITEAFVYLSTAVRADSRLGRVGFRCAVDEAQAQGLAAGGSVKASAPAGGQAGGDTLERVRTRGELRVGSEPGTPPMMEGAAGGPYSGFDFEVASAIASALGVELRIVPGRYADLPGGLARGDFDLIISGYVPDPSIADVAWSDPYLEFGLALIAKKGGPVRSVADLANLRVGVFNDPAAEKAARSLIPTARLEVHEEGYLELLEQGQLDGFLYDFPYAQAEVAKYPGGGVQIVQYNLTRQAYHVGMAPGQAGLQKAVNDALGALRASPRYKQLVRKYLGKAAIVTETRKGAKTVVVKSGDSLSSLAKKLYGDVGAWPRIWTANQHRIGNPDLIDVGMVLELPQ